MAGGWLGESRLGSVRRRKEASVKHRGRAGCRAQTVHHRLLVLQIAPGQGTAISAHHRSGHGSRHRQSRAEMAGCSGTSAMEMRTEQGGLSHGQSWAG